ncbi:MAG: metal-dependent hydrolase [Desulfovibrionaceae bacterium]
MDPVTHLTVGALAAQFTRRWIPDSRALWPFCLIAAVLPDIDNFVGLWGGPHSYLLDHRGVTHSVFGLAAMGVLLALAFRLISCKMRLLVALPAALFILTAHVFLDLITSYGTQLLAPFSDRRFSLDAVFIIDPVFTASLLIFVLLARLARERGFVFAAVGLLWIFAYPLTNMGVHDAVEAAAMRQARVRNPEARADVLPAPFAPVYWKVVVEDGDEYRATTVNVLNPGKEYETVTLPRAAPELMRRLGRQAPLIETFAWFARFPYLVEDVRHNGEKVLHIGDVRFHPVSPVMQAVRSGPPKMFTIRAVLDGNGELLRYSHRGRTYSPGAAALPAPAP